MKAVLTLEMDKPPSDLLRLFERLILDIDRRTRNNQALFGTYRLEDDNGNPVGVLVVED